MSVFNQLQDKQNREHQKKYAEYVRLLAQMDIHNPVKADQSKLEKLLGELGKTAEQAEQDYKLIQTAHSHEQLALQYEKRRKEAAKLQQDYLAACKKRQNALAELNEKVRLANNAKDTATGLQQESAQARQQLAKFKQEHEEIWAILLAARPRLQATLVME